MFCSGCGHALVQGQPVCAQCGRPVAPMVPPVPGLQFQLESYAGKVRALSLVWLIYAALSLFTGLAGLTFAHAFLSNHFGNWAHGPWSDGSGPPMWLGQTIFHFIWVALVFRGAGAACRMGSVRADAMGTYCGHCCCRAQPGEVPLRHGAGDLDPGGSARLSEHVAV